MRAELSQIPIKEVQIKPSDNGGKSPSTLYAILRRLSAKVNQLELQLSTVRRDLNRIDKKVYRQSDSLPSVETPVSKVTFQDIVSMR